MEEILLSPNIEEHPSNKILIIVHKSLKLSKIVLSNQRSIRSILKKCQMHQNTLSMTHSDD